MSYFEDPAEFAVADARHVLLAGDESSINELAESAGVDMPITQAVVAVVHEGVSAEEMVRRVLSRARKHEQT